VYFITDFPRMLGMIAAQLPAVGILLLPHAIDQPNHLAMHYDCWQADALAMAR
jgi:hypothetical protein